MADRTIPQVQMESFIAQITGQMTLVARELSTWATTEARTLEELEQMTGRSRNWAPRCSPDSVNC